MLDAPIPHRLVWPHPIQPILEPRVTSGSGSAPVLRAGSGPAHKPDRQFQREHHRRLRHGESLRMPLRGLHISSSLARRDAIPAGQRAQNTGGGPAVTG